MRGVAIAGLVITGINLLGGFAICLLRHGMLFSDATATFSALTMVYRLVSPIPALLGAIAAGDEDYAEAVARAHVAAALASYRHVGASEPVRDWVPSSG